MKVSEYGRKLFRHRATAGLPPRSLCGSIKRAPIFGVAAITRVIGGCFDS